MNMKIIRILALGALTIICGCSNPGIVQVSPDTYLLAREAHGGIFQSAAKMKADVIKDANEFAAKQGKVAVPISAKEKPMGSGPAQWASFEYQFRVVDKDDPSNTRTQVVHNPNVRIDKIDQDTVGIKTKAQKYEELLVLDKLRKSGIITEEEFEREKRELLNKS
ncbi:hypothetical protein GP2143_03278 [marine gamma proteobacterium HTCC2143]|uniref:SHOCT domain-containing protein n=1 Tax=marine gamma proteobacterium HTCC2143 TaxID=247633 RepID=A0YD07_9GAMM|nr:hypothetical protein GP2143_03278 [marine gamma proteobacterium HTCC2143]